MLRKIIVTGLMGIVPLALGGAAIAAPAEDGGIVVMAPRAIPVPAERSPYTGAPIATASVKIPVLYQDLDLAEARDGERLVTRIERVAYDACKQLDSLFPFNPDPECPRKAAASAKDAAKAMIASARQVR
ncbi:UrcA family protein [Novosphingobium sp. RD2P27]|uniref:UrcA family protein n=1 Tax=Novosphingobium kalidii TaxID=3230299 RepID=A0ABV2CWQ2_9SPHN